MVKKWILFLELFSVKIRPEIMLNSVRDRKETFFLALKKLIFQRPKKSHFSKGVNPCFWSKNVVFFLELFSVKIRLEIMFNNVLETKEIFFSHKKFNLSKPQKSHFSTGVNPCFSSKNVLFSLFVFGQNKTRNNV